jgi:fructose-1,6-bisphosphatase I
MLMAVRTLGDILENEDQNLRRLITLIADLSLQIVQQIPRSLGMTKGVNVYGERQTELDVWSNDLLTQKLSKSGLVQLVASEELAEPLSAPTGEYSVVLDPLDGSSNVKSNNLVGTIVGIYHGKTLPTKGRELMASGYFLYGPYVEFVLAVSAGVYIFVAGGEGNVERRFLSDGEPYHLPEPGSIYGIGGLRAKWTPRMRLFVEQLDARDFKFRYGGSFVGDYNQVLHGGGFFAYPELVDAPQGKYRLQFESNPIGFVTEKAGGKASTGGVSILDVEPTSLDQRVPTYVGNADLVSEFESIR